MIHFTPQRRRIYVSKPILLFTVAIMGAPIYVTRIQYFLQSKKANINCEHLLCCIAKLMLGDPRAFSIAAPRASNHRNRRAYRRQADEVLDISANLTDEQKLQAEFFDDKIASLGFSTVFAALSQGLTLLEFVHLDFVTNMAAHDAGIFIWQEKRRFDAVRPYSAIRYLYGDGPVLAWGGAWTRDRVFGCQ